LIAIGVGGCGAPKAKSTISIPLDDPLAVALTGDGRVAVASLKAGGVAAVDGASGKVLYVSPVDTIGETELVTAAVEPNQFIEVYNDGQFIRRRDAMTGKTLAQAQGSQGQFQLSKAAAACVRGNNLYVLDDACQVIQYDAETLKASKVAAPEVGYHLQPLPFLDVAPDQSHVAVTHYLKTMVYHVDKGTKTEPTNSTPTTSIAFAPDGKSLLVCRAKENTGVIKTDWHDLVQKFDVADENPVGAWSPDGRRVAIGEQGGTGHVWKIGQPNPESSFGSGAPIRSVVFTQDGKGLIVATPKGLEIYKL
jgi:DNA-binding beta-propeller fold protein YncE